MPNYEVTNVQEDQVTDANDDLVDVFDVTFTLANRSGTFLVQVPQSGDVVAEAYAAITAKANEVEAIYALTGVAPAS